MNITKEKISPLKEDPAQNIVKIIENMEKVPCLKIKYRRVVMGYNQRELGEYLGISTQQFQKYEKGTNRITAGKLKILSDILRVPLDYFFKNEKDLPGFIDLAYTKPKKDYKTDTSTFPNEEEMKDLMKKFLQIKNPKTRRKAINLIATLI